MDEMTHEKSMIIRNLDTRMNAEFKEWTQRETIEHLSI